MTLCAFNLVRWGDLFFPPNSNTEITQTQKSTHFCNFLSIFIHSFLSSSLLFFPFLRHLPSDSFLLPTTLVYNSSPFFFSLLCLAYVLCISMSTIVCSYVWLSVDNYDKTVQRRWKEGHDEGGGGNPETLTTRTQKISLGDSEKAVKKRESDWQKGGVKTM